MNHKRSLSHPSKLANQTTLRFSFAIHFAGAEDSRTKQSTIKSDAKFSFPIHTEKKEEKESSESKNESKNSSSDNEENAVAIEPTKTVGTQGSWYTLKFYTMKEILAAKYYLMEMEFSNGK